MTTGQLNIDDLQKLAYDLVDNLFFTVKAQNESILKFGAILEAVKSSQVEDNLLSVKETAELLRIKPASLLKSRCKGSTKGVRINDKSWGFYKSEVDKYLKRHNRVP